MNIGEVISALVLCASSIDCDKDFMLMTKDIFSIEIYDDGINITFVDSYNPAKEIKIHRDGTKEFLT